MLRVKACLWPLCACFHGSIAVDCAEIVLLCSQRKWLNPAKMLSVSITVLSPYPQGNRLLVDWKPNEKRKVSSGTLTPRYAVQKENFDPAVPRTPAAASKGDDGGRNLNLAPATGVAKPVPRPPTQQAPCTAEIKTIGAFPPLMRAVSWDAVGSLTSRSGAQGLPPTPEDTFSDRDKIFKASGYNDLSAQPGSKHKMSKLKEVKYF